MRQLSFTSIALSALLIACGGEYASAPAGGGGGGNVGFGGAQDIGQFRNLLEAGQIPGSATLDANGFFSEHRTELPPADCGQVICANAMLAVGRSWLGDDYQATLQISLTTPIDPSALVRKPLNLIVVVDTSGSMNQDNRISHVRAGLHLLVDALLPGDQLAIISYSDRASRIRSLGDAAEPAELHAIVDGLVANGSTNIYDGLELGFAEAATNLDLERQNRVILLSDGLATAGITGDDEILTMASGYIADGIGLTTIGVGLEFNVNLMRGLSERGAGNFYFIESSDAVTEVFTEELNYAAEPLALSVNIAVAGGANYALGEVTGTRLWKTDADGGSIFLPAVFVASRTDDENPNGRRGGGSALFIDLEKRGTGTAGQVATIELSYTIPGQAERLTQTIEVQNPLAPGETQEDLYVSAAAMAEHYAIYNTFLGLSAATLFADVGDYNCAVASLKDVAAEARAWNASKEDTDIAADLVLIDQFVANLVTAGADSEASGSRDCGSPNGEGDWEDDYDHGHAYACQAGGAGGAQSGFLAIVGLLIGLVRRRRR